MSSILSPGASAGKLLMLSERQIEPISSHRRKKGERMTAEKPITKPIIISAKKTVVA